MKTKRRSPIAGPLLTFGLMLGSVGLVLAAAHYLESKSSAPTVATSSTASTESNTHQ